MKWLETDSLSDQDISSPLAIGAFTATGDQRISCIAFADQLAGDGSYVWHITLQINGSGSHHILERVTQVAAAGETALGHQFEPIDVRSGDVLTVYIDGLAGDTTTPDTVVRWADVTPIELLTTQMTESYAADGSAPTIAQALFAIQQFLQERVVSDTTLTVKKIDGSTTAMTFTLNSAVHPTSLTRAT